METTTDKLFYKIGEVATLLCISASTLRFWEKEIPALKPRTNAKGDRQYTKDDIEKLQKIKFLVKDNGHTVAGAKKKLKNNSTKVEAQTEIAEKLLNLKSFLEEIRNQIS